VKNGKKGDADKADAALFLNPAKAEQAILI